MVLCTRVHANGFRTEGRGFPHEDSRLSTNSSTLRAAGLVDVERTSLWISNRFPIPNFLVKYQDGSKKHVNRAERDDLLLRNCLKQTGPLEYVYTGQAKTYHSFADFGNDYIPPNIAPALLRRFLPGFFIIELKDKRRRELMETPEACGLRLAQP